MNKLLITGLIAAVVMGMAGCGEKEGPAIAAPSIPDDALPENVVEAVAVLKGDLQDTNEVRRALDTLHAFEDSIVVYEERVVSPATGDQYTEVLHRFPSAGVQIVYSRGEFSGIYDAQPAE